MAEVPGAALVVGESIIQGRGLFAQVPIAAGATLLEYLGQKISKAESARRCELGNACIFCLDEEWDLDGCVESNLARFINHSCAPNCEAILDEDHGAIWIVTVRDIVPGEELTFNYGFTLEEFRDYPCQCGAPACVGYIVAQDYLDQVRRITQGGA